MLASLFAPILGFSIGVALIVAIPFVLLVLVIYSVYKLRQEDDL